MPAPFSAALIAGGKSLRMGRDKCLLRLPETNHHPLWKYQWEKLASLHPQEQWISGRAEQTYFPTASLVTDAWPEAGPLGGIASVLARIKTPLLLVLGVDLPGITKEILHILLSASSQTNGAVLRSENFYEPLVAVYPATMLGSANAMLEQGNFRLQHWVQDGVNTNLLRVLDVPSAWKPALRNLNTPTD